jgi:Ca2+-binding EF-hand superfamily protein
MVKQFFPSGDPEEFASYAYNMFGKNESGQIDFKGFICTLSLTSRGKVEDKLRCIPLPLPLKFRWVNGRISGVFQMYDTDKDGFVTYTDILQIARSVYKMAGGMVEFAADEDTPEKVGSLRPIYQADLSDSSCS